MSFAPLWQIAAIDQPLETAIEADRLLVAKIFVNEATIRGVLLC
jgi:hypothetical protein